MKIKNQEIFKLKSDKKTKRIAEKLAEKINKMTPEQRTAFANSLTNKINAIDEKYQDLKSRAINNEALIDNLYRDVSDDMHCVMIIVPALVFGVATGIITGFVSPLESNNEVVALMMGGAGLGLGAGFLGTHLYENKTISNSMIKIRQKLYNARLESIKKKRYKLISKLEHSNANTQTEEKTL